MASAEDSLELADLLLDTFRAYDTDGNGQVTLAEIKSMLQLLDPNAWTDDKCKRFLSSLDKNKDGVLDYTEFVNGLFGNRVTAAQKAVLANRNVVDGARKIEAEKAEEGRRKKEEERKAEEERRQYLARPLKNAEDPRYLAQLHEVYPFQGYIARTEERAITLVGVRGVLKFVKDQAHRWTDRKGKLLSASRVKLYDIDTWLVRPATKLKDCAFVELLTGQRQPPDWFVSHWWGEVHVDFLKCLEVHVKTREASDKTRFWVCAYANRQHSLQDDISDDPKKSSFFQALLIAEGRVLLILDAKTATSGPATAFTRIWCAFEEVQCLEQPDYDLDVAACKDSVASLLTFGLLAREENMEKRVPGSGYKVKSERERAFPLEIVEAGLKVELQKANASHDVDKTHILNSIAGRDLNLSALAEHPAYDTANKKLRALFATAFWRRSVSNPIDDATRNLQVMMTDALKHDEWRESLRMDLAGCDHLGDSQMKLFATGMPPKLRELKLKLEGLDIGNESLQALVENLPEDLEDIDLDMSNCKSVGDEGVAMLKHNLPPKLRSLRLALAMTNVSQEVQQLAGNLESFKQWDAPEPPERPPPEDEGEEPAQGEDE